MSEHDEDFSIEVTIGHREILATRENASLFTFAGDMATRNHVFIQTAEEDETTVSGAYIFSFTPGFERLAKLLVEHDYPQHLNMIDVPRCDESAFQVHMDIAQQNYRGEIPDTLPDDFK